MIKNKKIIVIIPARGGSKGLPGKNIKNMNGKPLIAWTIMQALNSKYIDEIFVSTNDKEIFDISIEYGANVPFLRPDKLALDSSPTSEAVIHALDKYAEQGNEFDYLIIFEPTSPLRAKEDLDLAIEKLVNADNADCLISIGEVHMEHPMITKTINDNGFITPYISNVKKIHQRQQADIAYFPYGVIYMSTVESYRKKETFYVDNAIPYEIERWQNYEIDDGLDFVLVEKIMKLNMEKING